MIKILDLIVLILVVSDARAETNELKDEVLNSSRQKRLLFYDEEGNLVKTYNNPHRYDYANNAEKIQIPLLGKFFNPFLEFLKSTPFGGGPTAYMIPVSDEVVQQINRDPIYQNKLMTVPRKDLVIEPNSLCAGKRTQIPTENCRNFLNCWDGWAFEQECPEGLLFAREGYCDYPHNVDCNQRSKEPTTTRTTTAASPQCSTEFESWRSEQQCSEFFVCVDRVPIKFKCPADLAYSQKLGVCDYRYRVDCNSPSAIGTGEPAEYKPNSMCSSAPPTNTANDPVSSDISPVVASPPASLGESVPIPTDGKIVLSNTAYNSQSWSSTHVAMSRQDAIRQLKLGATANVAVA